MAKDATSALHLRARLIEANLFVQLVITGLSEFSGCLESKRNMILDYPKSRQFNGQRFRLPLADPSTQLPVPNVKSLGIVILRRGKQITEPEQ